MANNYIYLLIDPFSSRPRYVGKSNSPKARLREHVRESLEHSHTAKQRWIRYLVANHRRSPIMVIVQQCGNDWPEQEKRWIALGHRLGWPLTNETAGGDGPREKPGPAQEDLRRLARALIRVSRQRQDMMNGASGT
jgi:hypothetical protein